MTTRVALALLLGLAACRNAPSALDHVPDSASASGSDGADPWATHGSGSGTTASTSGGGGPLGGVDIQAMLAKVRDNISKPGPYEAPEQSPGFDPAKPYWGVLDLGGGIVEREAMSWSGDNGTELATLIARLRELAKDSSLTGVLLRVEPLEISLPDAVELRAALHAFRAAGKHLACHAEHASSGTYLVLTACEQLALAPIGELAITGPAAMPIHIKPLLDKLGITADFLHVGAFKGAAEPLTLDAPSPQMLETLNAILDRRYQSMVDIIAADRAIDGTAVKALIDTGLFSAEQAHTAKLIDAVAPFEAFRDQAIAGVAWKQIKLKGDHKDSFAEMLKLARFFGAMPSERPTGAHVALVYAVGEISDGDGKGVVGARQEIASHTLVAALRTLTADDNVKAVVLRVDSPGGSAQASELIWQAVAQLKAKKPVIVSMSDVAASGGYYISSGATKIYALDDTLTGSIGVVGGKIAPGGALTKLGVNTYPMGRGKRALIMASLNPWSADDKAVIMATMQAVYDTFVARVAAGRGKTPADIQPIAQGRVWTGTKAKELGLVDAIGGLDAAIADAQALGKVDPATELETYPATLTLRDLLVSVGAVQLPFGLGADATTSHAFAELAALDPQLAASAARLVELAVSFRTTMIQTVAVIPEIR